MPVGAPEWGPKRQKATKLMLAAFNINSMPTNTRIVFLRVKAPARPMANSKEETSKHPARGVIAISPSWQQLRLRQALPSASIQSLPEGERIHPSERRPAAG